MKKRIHKALSWLLTLAMVAGMLPAVSITALAATPGITIGPGASGPDDGTWSYDETSNTLTLKGYTGGCIQLNTSVTVMLEGENTITVHESSGDAVCGINSQGSNGLTIGGTGSLTIDVSHTTRPTYGIHAFGVLTMSGGTVNITASSDSAQVYGVYGDAGVALEGGSLTVGVSGQSDGYGVFANAGKLTVGSGAALDVTVTNNGTYYMYGVLNNAYDDNIADNGDIALAGTVKVAAAGSGSVYGIANGSFSSNTDGVLSVTGGSVTVADAYYGIVSFTKGHSTAFADVDISGGTVNVTSDVSGSNGIISWNNGVTISGGTVTATSASAALRLADADSSQKTGLVNITGEAVVSLTSTGGYALYSSDTASSTRVHRLDFESGGSFTAQGAGDYKYFPVQAFFTLGPNTDVIEGRLSTASNADGGRMLQYDDITERVVAAYSLGYAAAGAVSVDGHAFASDKLYYNGEDVVSSGESGYTAHYDPGSGTLELNGYDGGPILIGASNPVDVTIELVGGNTVTADAPRGGVGNVCAGIDITNADNVTFTGSGTLTVNTNAGDGLTQVFGIGLHRSAAADENLTFRSGKVEVNVTAADTSAQVYGVSTVWDSVGGPITVAEGAELNVTLSSSSPYLTMGIYSCGDLTLNGRTAVTGTYTGSGSPGVSNWNAVRTLDSSAKITVGDKASIRVNLPQGLTHGFSGALLAANGGQTMSGSAWDFTRTHSYYREYENDACRIVEADLYGSLYADFDYMSKSGATAVTGVTVTAADDTLPAGGSTTATAKVTPDDATYPGVVWSSSNSNVTIDADGRVSTGDIAGKAVLTATAKYDSSVTGSTVVTVGTLDDSLIYEVSAQVEAPVVGELPAATAVVGEGFTVWNMSWSYRSSPAEDWTSMADGARFEEGLFYRVNIDIRETDAVRAYPASSGLMAAYVNGNAVPNSSLYGTWNDIVSVYYTFGKAADPIPAVSAIDFGIDQAAVGESPDMTADVTDTRLEATVTGWTDLGVSGTGADAMTAESKFEAGHFYECRVQFALSDANYRFPGAGMTVTANGEMIPETDDPDANRLVSCFAWEADAEGKIVYTVYLRGKLAAAGKLDLDAVSRDDGAICYTILPGGTAASVSVFAAQYQGGRLVDVKQSAVTDVQSNKVSGQLTGFTHAAGSTYRVFLLQDGKFVPLCHAVDLS